jgi:aryl sulfotransferase
MEIKYGVHTPSKAHQADGYPQKTREMKTAIFDSSVWNDFHYRNDDIIITSYAKSGTTWVQQIVGQLLFNGATDINISTISPWLDHHMPPREKKLALLEQQQHRRFLKTHLPPDTLVFSPQAKYIYIARDGRDVAWSLHNHHADRDLAWGRKLAESAGMAPQPDTTKPILEFFREWLEKDGYPFWPYWENISGWWKIKDHPNVHFIHYANLKRDLPLEIERIAQFLGIPKPDAETWQTIVYHCSFEYMKDNAEQFAPMGGKVWKGGAKTFIYKGVNQRWKDVLSAEDIRRYEAIAVAQLGPACAHWLATGEMQ